jgi:two-component system osmolarity sensor histidine kinase EnvZ
MATAADTAPSRPFRSIRRRIAGIMHDAMPTGLFARSLIIIIMPVILLQGIIVFAFSERHWWEVTTQLSQALVGDIAALVDVIETYPQDADYTEITRIAQERMGLNIAVLKGQPLPATGPKPFFEPLDGLISTQIGRQIGKPFFIDTVGRSNLIEVRILLDNGNVLRVFAPRNQAYVSSSLTLIAAMVATSIVLLAVAILFLRNQIQPILTLTAAVDDFGKGRPVPDFPPRGAREVRQATIAFQDMKRRVERMIEQRTAMLAGVSHDLRTVLTRMRLQLAILEQSPGLEDLAGDVDAMHKMLEGYLAFARGDAGEHAALTDMADLLDEIAEERLVFGSGGDVTARFVGDPLVRVRPQGFKRCVENLVANAARHGRFVEVSGVHADGHLTVTVDDDGPGIPVAEREAVFKPFYRLDNARNIDESGTGLGLPIARDIARSHGGDIILDDSPLGGLRATVTVPA